MESLKKSPSYSRSSLYNREIGLVSDSSAHGEMRIDEPNRQKTLADASTFGKYKKPTRREKFLAEMERIVPLKEFCALIEPFYPKAGKGRPPVGGERMLRIHFLQSWFNLSDPVAVFDLACPNGLQQGLSDPVAILLNEGHDLLRIANDRRYRAFTSIEDFRRYVENEVLAIVR